MDITRVTADQIDTEVLNAVFDLFAYHPWNDEQKKASEHIREACYKAVGAIIQFAPPSADRTTAIRKIREACMDANQAITFGGK